MSWRRRAAAGLCVLTLAGCGFRPLYGRTTSGVPLADVLASIDVLPITAPVGQERLAHSVRSELIYELDGSGQPRPKRYKLTLETAESVQVTTVDTTTGRADAAVLNATVKYTLAPFDGAPALTSGTARGTATYYRDQQRFASVRAARDAEIRLSKQLADEIKQRLAALFATRG